MNLNGKLFGLYIIITISILGFFFYSTITCVPQIVNLYINKTRYKYTYMYIYFIFFLKSERNLVSKTRKRKQKSDFQWNIKNNWSREVIRPTCSRYFMLSTNMRLVVKKKRKKPDYITIRGNAYYLLRRLLMFMKPFLTGVQGKFLYFCINYYRSPLQ